MVNLLRDILLKKRRQREYRERRQYHSIPMPAAGMQKDFPSTMIPEAKTPKAQEMTFKNGVAETSYGTTVFAGTGTAPFRNTVMHIDQFNKSDATNKLMLHTLTDTFVYNTTSKLFETYTAGLEVEDCEDAWNESVDADVVSTADNTSGMVRRGTYSAKLAVGAAVSAGDILATETITKNLTTYTHIHLYIYSSVALASGDLQLLLDNTANCASPLESLDIPAVVADTWTEVQLTLVTPAGLGSLISIGLKMIVDKGAFNVWLDDIRATVPHSGTAGDIYSSVVMNDLYIFNNNVDKIKKWNGSATEVEDLTGATAYQAIAMAKLGERLNLYRTTESSTIYHQRVRWCKPGNPEDWTAAGAGANDLVSELGSDSIMTADNVGNGVAIYGQRHVVMQEYKGSFSNPYSFRRRLNIGVPSARLVGRLESTHVFVGSDNDIYEYAGGLAIRSIGKPIRADLFDRINPEYIERAFIVVAKENREVEFHFPTGTGATPDNYWVYNYEDKTWSERSRSYTSHGFYFSNASLKWSDMTGYTWASISGTWSSTFLRATTPLVLYGDASGVVSKGDPLTKDLNGVAVDSYFDTKDFVVGERYTETTTYWACLTVEAKGQDFDLYYSTDYGQTYTLVPGADSVSLTETWGKVRIDFEIYSPAVRFRLRNSTAAEGFAVRYFEIGYYEGPDR